MKKLVFILSALVLIALLCSCSAFGNTEDTTAAGDGDTTATETATEEETTTMPRLDYYEADLDRYIAIDRTQYEKIEVTISDEYEIGDDEVAAYIEGKRFANKVEDTDAVGVTDQPIALGDVVHFYYRGTVDGVAFSGGSYLPDENETPASLEIGSGKFIPGFEDAMIGIVPNTTSADRMTSITVTFPDSYYEELRGKEAVFELYVVSVDKYILPTYDDAFITDVLKYEAKKDSYAEGELRAEFEAAVAEQLRADMEEDLKAAKIAEVWQVLYTLCTVHEIPQIEYDYYHAQYMNQFEEIYEYYNTQSLQYYGYKMYESLDEFVCEYMSLDAGADWEAELERGCKEIVTQNLLFHIIARQNDMEEITDEEYRAELEYYASYYGYTDTSKLEEAMGASQIRESALYNKVAEWLLARTETTFADLSDAD